MLIRKEKGATTRRSLFRIVTKYRNSLCRNRGHVLLGEPAELFKADGVLDRHV